MNSSPDTSASEHSYRSSWTKIISLILYSLALVGGSSALTILVLEKKTSQLRGTPPRLQSGPWGDLQTFDIRVEQPKEYAAFEQINPTAPQWHWGTSTLPEIRSMLLKTGLSDSQVGSLLAPENVSSSETDTIVTASQDIVLSLSPVIREKIYRILALNPANRLQAHPFYIPDGDLGKVFNGDKGHSAKITNLVKRLLYVRNGFHYFSDLEVVLQNIETAEARLNFFQSLTGQNAVVVRLLIRPTSDIDKIIGYWGPPVPGLRAKDLRPLFEAEQRLPQGGAISLLNILPPLARERLYTFPMPPGIDQPPKLPDCHWTALNFFSLKPDNRFSDESQATQAVLENYYQIGQPSIYGDLVLVLDPNNRAIHSAVYIADDLVFTKNGINYAIPWIIMRKNDLVGTYSYADPVKVVYYRRKDL